MGQILITGGAGYIGSHVVKGLSKAGEQVVVFDNLSQGKQASLLHNEELIIGDITDREALARVFATHQIDTIMHFAALVNAAESNEKEAEYRLVNAEGSRNVWEAGMAAGVKHFLYASSAAVYGIPQSRDPLTESSPLKPSNVYGETKLAGEESLKHIVTASGSYLAFRFFNVGGADPEGRLGQSQSSRAIMQRLFAATHSSEKVITISGHDYSTADGTVVRDFVHAEDLSDAFLKGLAYLRGGGESKILNLGAGVGHTIGEVATLVQQITKTPLKIVYGPAIPGDIDYSLADISLAKQVLDWSPSHSLANIISDGYRAYAQQNP